MDRRIRNDELIVRNDPLQVDSHVRQPDEHAPEGKRIDGGGVLQQGRHSCRLNDTKDNGSGGELKDE